MLYFSYNDFMDNQEKGKRKKIKKVEEEIAVYEQKSYETIQEINRYPIINSLHNKEELKEFLNDFFNIKTIIENPNIVYCNIINANTDKNSKNMIVCKIKEKEIFIIVKEISEIDLNIAYKMFEHSSNIINSWNNKNIKPKIRNPIVVPIVIYTGKSIWKNNNSRIHDKVNYVTYKDNVINFSYNMLNINDIKKEELEKMNSKTSSIILTMKNKYLQIN